MTSFESLISKQEPKHFTLNLREFPTLEQITLPERRYYLDSEGNEYESATTFLGRHSDSTPIDEWIARVGKEEADRVTERAAKRGTECHECIEDYLNNTSPRHTTGIGYGLFKKMIPVLNKIDMIEGIECQLMSKRLGIAGTADCIGEYDGKLSVIDFKTSIKDKRKDWISNYFIQGTLYALMYYELFGVLIEQIVILIGVEKSWHPQVYRVNTKDYIQQILDMVKED